MRILIVPALMVIAACSPGAAATALKPAGNGLTPKYRNILLRDFRTVRDGVVVNYNIGTAAHCPGTLAALRKILPEDVRITVWADAPLCPELQEMMDRRWPDVNFVYGELSSDTAGDLKAAVDSSDLLLISSGSSVASSVKKSVDSYHALTGKSVAVYAVGSVPDDLAQLMDFCWIRDEISLGKYAGIPSVCGWAPDAVFDFDCRDDVAARRFMAEKGLKDGGFICLIPGNRYTPRWEYFGGKEDRKKSAMNEAMADSDNAVLRDIATMAVREKGLKVLICAEQVPELKLAREVVYDRLPEDVKARCVVLDTLWSPQMALGVYSRSRAVAGIEMHSQVMAVGNGIPAVVLRHSGFGSKSDMWRTVGLGEWLFDIDDPGAGMRACAAVRNILEDRRKAVRMLKSARMIIDDSERAALKQSFFLSE